MSINYYTGPRPTRFRLTAANVYTFLDAEGAPLYVGCTSQQYARRFAGHGRKDWWTDVAEIRVEHFEDKSDGLRRERQLIRELRPKHNIAQHPDRDPLILEWRRKSRAIDQMYADPIKEAA